MDWTTETTDFNAGPDWSISIAGTLNVPPTTVTAALLFFFHPAGNTASVLLFRAIGVSADAGIGKWVPYWNGCGGQPTPGTLADRNAVLIHELNGDTCSPTYVLKLSDVEIAVIAEHVEHTLGPYPTAIPYRPASDIAQIVQWLDQHFEAIPLATGGPEPRNG
jgi:hypothetical protein